MAALLLSACATAPLPDGSRILRAPEGSIAPAPALSPEEAKRLAELNARILAEQRAAREREELAEAWRHPPSPYWYTPHWHAGWYWTGRHWARRPRWSLGFGYWGP